MRLHRLKEIAEFVGERERDIELLKQKAKADEAAHGEHVAERDVRHPSQPFRTSSRIGV